MYTQEAYIFRVNLLLFQERRFSQVLADVTCRIYMNMASTLELRTLTQYLAIFVGALI